MELNDLNFDDETQRNLEDQGDPLNLFDNPEDESPVSGDEDFPGDRESDIIGNDEPDLFE